MRFFSNIINVTEVSATVIHKRSSFRLSTSYEHSFLYIALDKSTTERGAMKLVSCAQSIVMEFFSFKNSHTARLQCRRRLKVEGGPSAGTHISDACPGNFNVFLILEEPRGDRAHHTFNLGLLRTYC